MVKRYSIAEARDNLAAIVHELEAVNSVEITRRGQPVAVLVSKQVYDRLQARKAGFWAAYSAFRKRAHLEELKIDPSDIWGDVREKSSGRAVEL
ncbi:MAG TPA: type II toxin-antitoxin system Phd/YefM family antitoxin [Candidatus Obscuribacterales bacterium]